jgi:sterol 3beta-glucosyltransferase
MRVGLMSWGSDGDIRPLIALGAGLAGRGHRVTLAAASVQGSDYAGLCAAAGIAWRAIPIVDAAAVLRGIAALGVQHERDTVLIRRLFERLYVPALAGMTTEARALVADSDALAGHHMAVPLSAAARAAGRPLATVTYWPGFVPRDDLPPPGLPCGPRWFNRRGWWLLRRMIDSYLLAPSASCWGAAGLGPLARVEQAWFAGQINLVAAPRVLCPPAAEWTGRHLVTGPLLMPERAEGGALPAAVEAFLAAGPPPLHLGLGSPQEADPVVLTRLLVEAARLAGVRALVRSHDPALPPGTMVDRVLAVGALPHRQLLPRCAGVLHHGGAGTTATALAAGLPAAVVPFSDEQKDWARRLAAVGACAGVLPVRRATPERLAPILRRLAGDQMLGTAARAAAAAMAAEDGVAAAVAAVEALGG